MVLFYIKLYCIHFARKHDTGRVKKIVAYYNLFVFTCQSLTF